MAVLRARRTRPEAGLRSRSGRELRHPLVGQAQGRSRVAVVPALVGEGARRVADRVANGLFGVREGHPRVDGRTRERVVLRFAPATAPGRAP